MTSIPDPNKYVATIGDGFSTSFTILHNFGTKEVFVSLHPSNPNVNDTFGMEDHSLSVDTNEITIVFPDPPAINAYVVVILR